MKLFLIICATFATILASPEEEKKIFCTHGKWHFYFKGNSQFGIDQVDPFLCTHFVYSFFGIDPNGTIAIRDKYLDLEENYGLGNLRKVSKLKEINPKLKTLASVGGWTEGSAAFSEVANDPEKRKKFARDALDFLQKYNFDGLDLDWEYPRQREGSRETDREAFTLLVKDLHRLLHPRGLLLTALVSSVEPIAEGSYEIPQITRYLDFIKLKTLDMHGAWDAIIGFNSPLYERSGEEGVDKYLNANAAVSFWLKSGVPSEKLILGVPLFGRGFKMVSEDQNTAGSPHAGPSDPGPHTTDPGIMGYNELCEKRLTENWKDHWSEEQLVPYTTWKDQWIGYDNEESVSIKARYVRKYKLGGIMAGAIEMDDFKGFCGRGTFPLLKEINRTLKEKSPNEAQMLKKFCMNAITWN
uniref:chitinase n=1 Tax=Phlebotomus papatasi TaxID=29031 RepID=A0A1B0DN92_PHLPP